MLWHLCDAWRRRREHNVVLVHYEDLSADLEGQMRRLADRFGIGVPEHLWPELVAAGFPAMRERARQLAPEPAGVLKDRSAFFRRGRSGAGQSCSPTTSSAAITPALSSSLRPTCTWLHHESGGLVR